MKVLTRANGELGRHYFSPQSLFIGQVCEIFGREDPRPDAAGRVFHDGIILLRPRQGKGFRRDRPLSSRRQNHLLPGQFARQCRAFYLGFEFARRRLVNLLTDVEEPHSLKIKSRKPATAFPG